MLFSWILSCNRHLLQVSIEEEESYDPSKHDQSLERLSETLVDRYAPEPGMLNANMIQYSCV